MAILYGYEAKNTEDRMLKVLNDGVKTIGLSASISSLVLELLPPRRCLPLPMRSLLTRTYPVVRFLPDWLCGSWLKGVPTGTRQMLYDAWKIPFDHAVKQMASVRHDLRDRLQSSLLSLQDRDHNFKCYVSDALKATDNDQTTVINTAASLYLGA